MNTLTFMFIGYGMLCYAFGIVMGRSITKDKYRANGTEELMNEYNEKWAEVADAQQEEIEDLSSTDLIQSEEEDVIDLTDIVFEIKPPIPERKKSWGTVLMEVA